MYEVISFLWNFLVGSATYSSPRMSAEWSNHLCLPAINLYLNNPKVNNILWLTSYTQTDVSAPFSRCSWGRNTWQSPNKACVGEYSWWWPWSGIPMILGLKHWKESREMHCTNNMYWFFFSFQLFKETLEVSLFSHSPNPFTDFQLQEHVRSGRPCTVLNNIHDMMIPLKLFAVVIASKVVSKMTYISSVNGWWPPKCKSSVWNLIQPRSLSIGQFLVLHGFFKATGLLPKQTLPCGEVSSFEEGVFKNTLHTT